jgi:hypothetical protein
MKTMSSKEIKDRYGEFAETARREPVVHTSHGRPTLVTISIDRAKDIPSLRNELHVDLPGDKQEALKRFLSLGGIGVRLAGEISADDLAARSAKFRGNDEE